MHRYVYNFFVSILAAALLTSCGSADKAPAEAALKGAEEAVNVAKADVSKYMPDQAKFFGCRACSGKGKIQQG
jgi:hypothetical protein